MKYIILLLLGVCAASISAQQTCMTPAQIVPIPAGLNPDPLGGDYCVSIYIEVDHDIVLDKGSDGAREYIDDLMQEVADLYDRDGITLNWSTYLWEQPSPYSSASSSGMLSQFRQYRTDYTGDVAMLLSYQASGGIAYVDVLCSKQFGYAYSSISPTYNTYPDYSWSVMVIAHELGHNLGSPHTQACVWNGDNTPIDGCFQAEGSCGPAPIPSDGGTIMSYCHLNQVGINMSKGFGPQPLALIKNRIAGTGCSECLDGPDEPEEPRCADSELIMELLLDNYPQETSWRIQNEDGAIVAYSSPFLKNQMNSYQADTICLPDGCYTLVVTDVDGLRGFGCSEGFYILNGPDGELSAGQDFAGEQITRFCLGETEGDDCDRPDLNATFFSSYANQDKTNDSSNEGDAIVLTGNTWQVTPFNYTVTPATYLHGEVYVESIGEIHGIGLVEHTDYIVPNLTFRLAGRQGWGTPTDQVEAGKWEPFTIHLGQFSPHVDYNYLLLVNDDDGGGPILTKWRNIRVCEE